MSTSGVPGVVLPTPTGQSTGATSSSTSTPPGVVPPSGGFYGSSPTNSGLPWLGTSPGNNPYFTGNSDFSMFSPLNPALNSYMFNYLGQNIGQGATPFDLSALLPSSGGVTGKGQLSAPLTSLLESLQSFYGGKGSNIPGLNQLGDIATKGISAVPTWNTMVDAMQRQIQEGSANLKEQFNVGGNLASSPYGTAAADYQLQSNKDLNSLLAQMQFQGIQDQMQAGQFLTQGAQDTGQFLQGLDQQSIDKLYQEFIRTRPEYNPLLQYQYGASTTFPAIGSKGGVGGGGAGALAAGAGQGAGAIIEALAMAGVI